MKQRLIKKHIDKGFTEQEATLYADTILKAYNEEEIYKQGILEREFPEDLNKAYLEQLETIKDLQSKIEEHQNHITKLNEENKEKRMSFNNEKATKEELLAKVNEYETKINELNKLKEIENEYKELKEFKTNIDKQNEAKYLQEVELKKELLSKIPEDKKGFFEKMVDNKDVTAEEIKAVLKADLFADDKSSNPLDTKVVSNFADAMNN